MVIVNLEMDPDELRKRVLGRHQGDENAADLMAVMMSFIRFYSSIVLVEPARLGAVVQKKAKGV